MCEQLPYHSQHSVLSKASNKLQGPPSLPSQEIMPSFPTSNGTKLVRFPTHLQLMPRLWLHDGYLHYPYVTTKCWIWHHFIWIQVFWDVMLCHLMSGSVSKDWHAFVIKGQTVREDSLTTDDDTMILHNIRDHKPNTASHCRELEVSVMPLSKIQTRQHLLHFPLLQTVLNAATTRCLRRDF